MSASNNPDVIKIISDREFDNWLRDQFHHWLARSGKPIAKVIEAVALRDAYLAGARASVRFAAIFAPARQGDPK